MPLFGSSWFEEEENENIGPFSHWLEDWSEAGNCKECGIYTDDLKKGLCDDCYELAEDL